MWLENNEGGQHDKQDCELNAFKRLSVRLKELYPRLPMVIVADALYANAPVMDICRACPWDYMLVVKEGVLKDLNEEISLRPDRRAGKTKKGCPDLPQRPATGGHRLSWRYWQQVLLDHQHGKRISPGPQNSRKPGALEDRKRGLQHTEKPGYNLQHKYSRTDFNAVKNYYQCIQIAHLIEQLTLLAKTIKKLLAGKTTILKISERIRNMLVFANINPCPINRLLDRKIQIRFK